MESGERAFSLNARSLASIRSEHAAESEHADVACSLSFSHADRHVGRARPSALLMKGLLPAA